MRKYITFITAIILLSCNNATKDTGKKGSIEDSGAAVQISTASGTEITVTLTGGANAGTYTATSADPTCSEGLTGDNSFGNQYSAKGKADNEMSSLQLIIDDINAAKNGTDKFSLEVAFGKLLGGKSYQINTRDADKEGSGKATLTASGATRTVVIEGKTKEGVGISVTIKCTTVITAG